MTRAGVKVRKAEAAPAAAALARAIIAGERRRVPSAFDSL
jgi:hypothetical protein